MAADEAPCTTIAMVAPGDEMTLDEIEGLGLGTSIASLQDDTMQNFVQTVTAFVPVIQSAPMWVKAYFSLWLVATVGLGLSVIFTNGADGRASTDSPVNVAAQITPAPVTWPTTGDSAIDQTHAALNALNKQPNPTEGQLISGLRFIFFKPVFRHIYEEPPQRALFTFCRAQKLLEAYVSKFSSPDARRRLIDATQNLISLQDQLGALYGPAFSRDQQCELHGNTLSDYVSTLPPRGQERSVSTTLIQPGSEFKLC